MNNYIVRISELALITLDENIIFIRKFNPNYSLNLREKIIKEIDNLLIFPHANPIYKRTSNYTYRKKIVNNRYNIIYALDKNIIYVFYILDGRQAYDKYFKSLK